MQTTTSSSFVVTSNSLDTMFSFGSAPSNPFLPDDGDNDFLVTKTCRDPNCKEKALKGFATCLNHYVSPHSSDDLHKVPRPDSLHNASNGNVNGTRLPLSLELGSPPNRKQLDGKTTARKSAARTSFYPAESKLNKNMSANTRLTNGHASTKLSFSRPPEPMLTDGAARKKQRIFSPKHDDLSLHPPRSASPLAMPNGVFHGLQNGESIDTNLPHSGKLPTLNGDLHHFAPVNADISARQRPVLSSYGDYLRSPLTAGLNFSSDLPRLNAGPIGNANGTHLADSRLRDAQKTDSSEKIQSQKAPPTKTTPTRTKPSQNEKVSASPHSRLKPISRTPPLEKQRRLLVKKQDTSSLDDFIYGQPGSSQPPPGVERPHKYQEPKKLKNALYTHIDPRSHRMRPHSEEWYRQKEEEIKARGGRKANFGKAAQRMKDQRLKEDPESFETGLPDRVLNNENWVSALRWFDGQNVGEPQASIVPATPIRAKRSYRRRQTATAPDPE